MILLSILILIWLVCYLVGAIMVNLAWCWFNNCLPEHPTAVFMAVIWPVGLVLLLMGVVMHYFIIRPCQWIYENIDGPWSRIRR
jgi:hypothetical protein